MLQLVSADGLLVSVETLLVHESGEFVRTTLKLTARDVSAQALGSLVTYLRRYALSALVGVVGDDDDDANAADALKSVKPEKARETAKGGEGRDTGAGDPGQGRDDYARATDALVRHCHGERLDEHRDQTLSRGALRLHQLQRHSRRGL